MRDLDGAVQLYKKRAHIETFFSDQKSRGFNIHKSHLSEPTRLCRLLLASCLAYLWIVYLGVCATQEDWMQQLHRQDRCDLSLFRLGLRLLARCLKDQLPIPEGFLVPVVFPCRLCAHFKSKQPCTYFLYGSQTYHHFNQEKLYGQRVSSVGIA